MNKMEDQSAAHKSGLHELNEDLSVAWSDRSLYFIAFFVSPSNPGTKLLNLG